MSRPNGATDPTDGVKKVVARPVRPAPTPTPPMGDKHLPCAGRGEPDAGGLPCKREIKRDKVVV